ncbi:MAG: hypothetical protein IPG55_00575 [Saprospiraceae bacterium]|nr:hypothetical protein [Candidatus Defluviibacterium haderslevense]MBK7243812.1 hypothetical protein [Candidatus Defluviibacterium haderslevense]
MNTKLTLRKAEKFFLKEHADFDEQWLRKVIEDDPSIIGLGELELKEAERIQPKAGRLDLLLYDRGNEKRYEVEIMLGKINESHIIRAIEYWDIERKRYPNYEHCAVVIAEDITSRFLNIIGLFNGQIPIIAIQLNALSINDDLVLDFVKVLDELTVGEEEDEVAVKKDRTFWNNKANAETLELVDECGNLLKELDSELALSYTQNYIGVVKRNRPLNFVIFLPKQKFLRAEIKVSEIELWTSKIEENEFEIVSIGKRSGRIKFRIVKNDIANKRVFLKELFQVSYTERTI